MNFNFSIEIGNIAEKLKEAGFQAYLVGGCVRDLIMGVEPKDWDIATDAVPEEIQRIFPDSVYENKFGTVLVKPKPQTIADDTQKNAEGKIPRNSALNPRESALNVVEITTFRLEGKYTDKRHPDEIKFAKTIEEDLGRRDFTMNAIAAEFPIPNPQFPKIIDPYGGQKDIKNKIIRTVGESEARFDEDALRLMRAARFGVNLGFSIEDKTAEAIKRKAGLLEMIAKERIRDELAKILTAKNAAAGIQMLEDLNLLRHIMPELREGIGVGQNKHHIYTVWEHNLRALDYAAEKNYPLEIRMAALLHDVAKPRTKRGEGQDCTFYGHDAVGARMAAGILDRLHFSRQFVEKTARLVRHHLFYYNVGEVTEAGVRRFLNRVDPENVDDFIKVREADRIGSGVPKAVPYKLRHLLFMIEKVKRDPISSKMLTVNGDDVMKILGVEPGPKVGRILGVLLDEVMENPENNAKENLESRIKSLGKLPDDELEKMAQAAKEKKEEFESGIEEEMKEKYYVR